MNDQMRIEYIALDEVVRWPRNPKTHDEATLDQSIERFGYVQPLMFDETSGRIVAGHGRLEALQRRKAAGKEPPKRVEVRASDGAWTVPVIRGVGFATEQEAQAYVIADNRLVELGGWDEVALGSILEELITVGGVSDLLLGIGFSRTEDTAAQAPLVDLGAVQFTAITAESAEARLKTTTCPHCSGQVPI